MASILTAVMALATGAAHADDLSGTHRYVLREAVVKEGRSPDQLGYGHSPDGPWSLSYQMMADDAAAIVEQLGLGPVDVVEHSDGANLALILARDHQQMLHRLVISGQ